MQAFATAFENFIFKAFTPWGRASRSEYWLIMPLVWLLLIVMLVLDLETFWGALRQREVPPSNPLSYGFLLLFLLTLPSRLSLTMRRLHDVGRSGRWAFAPVKASLLAFWFILGITTAAMTVDPAVAAGVGISAFGIGAIFSLGGEAFWPFMFEVAQQIDIWTLLDTATNLVSGTASHVAGNLQAPDLSSFGSDPNFGPVAEAEMLGVVAILTFGPIILMFFYFLFLVLPGTEDSNKFGAPSGRSGQAQTATRKGKATRNPYAGYAFLVEGGAKQIDPEARRAEVAALYKTRVLGQGGPGSMPGR